MAGKPAIRIKVYKRSITNKHGFYGFHFLQQTSVGLCGSRQIESWKLKTVVWKLNRVLEIEKKKLEKNLLEIE